MDKAKVENMIADDLEAITEIYNYYIENSMAAYRTEKVNSDFFYENILVDGIKVLKFRGETIGFGLLRPYNPAPAFDKTSVVGYFISEKHTGKGHGQLLLDSLIKESLFQKRNNILAHISSLNEASLKFHKKNGFIECARLSRIGEKNNRCFDIVYMQKIIVV